MNDSKKTYAAILLGNVLEHYDSALFSLLSPVFAPLFFPEADPLTALILTYCMVPIGIIAKPLGSLFFGFIGDNKGRKEALVISLAGMAITTGLMGFIPVYEQVGRLSQLFLLLSRFLQAFFAAGETMGGAIFLLENSEEEKKDFISGLFGSSTIAGILLASGAVSLLFFLEFIDQGWRILYLFGFLTALSVLFLRTGVNVGTKDQIKKRGQKYAKFSWHPFLTIMLVSGFSYASYAVSLVLMNGFVPLIANVSLDEMMHVNTLLLFLDCLLLPIFGILAKRYSREKMMMLSSMAAFLIAIPLFSALEGATYMTAFIIRMIFIIMGVGFSAPYHSWAQNLVPYEERYMTLSFAYSLGSQIFGTPTVALSLWLFKTTGWVGSAAFYWMMLACGAMYCIACQKKSSLATHSRGLFKLF